jgi:pepsin A
MAITSALLDTGNTCVSIPDMFSKDILKQFNTKSNVCGYDEEEFAPQFSLLRCKVGNYDELPVLKIFIGQEEYVLDKDVYMQRCIKKEGADLCDTFIESVKRDFRLFLGDGFFNRYYAFFDLENKQIGLAKNREQLSHSNVYIAESEMDEEDRKFFDGLKQN